MTRKMACSSWPGIAVRRTASLPLAYARRPSFLRTCSPAEPRTGTGTGSGRLRSFSRPQLRRIDGFAFDKHCDVFLDPRHPGLGLFGAVDPVKDRVAIGAVERLKKALCRLAFRQRRNEIVRHLRGALRRIGGVPAAILFGAFDLFQSGRLHALQFDELKRPGAVFLGPPATRLTRREAIQPIPGIVP